MSNFIIVIGRQYGAGGRIIGKAIAKELGFAYYDTELLAEAATQIGFSPDIFNIADERRPSALRSIFSFQFGLQNSYEGSLNLSEENIFHAQSKVLKHLADKSPAVFVGRTADYILRDSANLLSIFIHAPLEFRVNAIIERGETDSIKLATDLAVKHDKQREDYYNYYTNRNWGIADNYDLTINAQRFSIPDILLIIKNFIAKMGNK